MDFNRAKAIAQGCLEDTKTAESIVSEARDRLNGLYGAGFELAEVGAALAALEKAAGQLAHARASLDGCI